MQLSFAIRGQNCEFLLLAAVYPTLWDFYKQEALD
jgi:hypothetical protein